MYRDNFYHSSEGSTWTKKNHKYIRKEGNRYIYPEDLQREQRKSGGKLVRKMTDVDGETFLARGAAATKTIASKSKHYDKASGERLSSSEVMARNAVNKQGSTDYKQLGKQHANRKAAANGKVVNPIATWRGSDGKVLARVKTNEKVSMPTTSDYKKYGQLRGGEANRSKTVNKQGSQSGQELAKQRMTDQKRRVAVNKQGSTNRQQDAKEFKEYRDWEKNDIKKRDSQPVKASKEYYDSVRSNTKNDKEFNDYLDKHNVARPDGSKPQKVETWDNSKNIETWDNSKNIKTWDNEKAKKSTKGQKGHFTYDAKSGQTIFVPDDEGTKKRVSKGKQIVDKIKGLFKKK